MSDDGAFLISVRLVDHWLVGRQPIDHPTC